MERDRRNATEELRDRRRQRDRERRMVARSRRRTYVAPSVWRVNPSGVLKKLKNTSSKQTFDSIIIQVSTQPSSFYRETRLSTSRLKAALIASREASCVLYVCTSYIRQSFIAVWDHDCRYWMDLNTYRNLK